MRTRFKSFVRHRPRAAAATPLLAAAILLAGCSAERPGDLADGEPLRVLTRNAPTTWYQGADGDKGPEHDLAQSFARYLGVPVEFVILDSIEEILEAVADNRGHLAAAGLTRTEVRLGAGLVFGPPYHSVTQQVVCRRGGEIPEDVSGLIGREIAVIAGSSYDERLGELKADYPELEVSGDADAVPVGDLHIPNMVSYALTGIEGGDEGMLEALEPWAGHRQRVVRMVKIARAGKETHRPRPFRYDITRI